ncbi:hypothetical protein [Curtobacterium sp. MCSS17_007]|uniref:hypothetical protein n=1 Tax=Curtobacterium sp. MCSS17_007 TaxID=2175646 RepID=UPI000DA7D744|nr:hypothetical protein [Curtobacterium sp. MCSS17_007]WIE74477.1 hypothetical protein DEJ22_009295 [Curtobacterium sp. MCSS17_007]
MNRLNRSEEESLIARIKSLEDAVRELKTGNQYVEAVMYETQSANQFDLSGTFNAAPGANYAVAIFSVARSAADGETRFHSQVVPQLFTPTQSTLFEDTGATALAVTAGQSPGLGGSSIEYYYRITTRAATPTQSFWFKYIAYATTPVIVSVARVL